MLNTVNDCIHFVSQGGVSMWIFLYVCADMLYACVCTWVWMPPCVYMWRVLRVLPGIFLSLLLPTVFLVTKSLTGPGAHGLASESLGSTSLPLLFWAYRQAPVFPAVTWVLRIQTQLSCLWSRHATSPTQPSPQASIWGKWNKYFL